MILPHSLWPTRSIAIATLTDQAVIAVDGDDAQSWLNGQLTQQIADMNHGEARYSLIVNLKGRVLADAWVLHQGKRFSLIVPSSQLDVLLQRFDDYIIMEDVEISVVDDQGVVSVQGPLADDIAPDAWPVDRLGKGGRELLVPSNETDSIAQALSEKAASLGGGVIDEANWEQARVAQGVPQFGVDFGDFTYPQEAGLQTRAVSFDKGCYLGQEAVVMLEHRGKPPKRLVHLHATAPLAEGAEIHDGKTPAGKITSAAKDPQNSNRWWALALLKRDHAQSDELRVGDVALTEPQK